MYPSGHLSVCGIGHEYISHNNNNIRIDYAGQIDAAGVYRLHRPFLAEVVRREPVEQENELNDHKRDGYFAKCVIL